MAQVECEIDFDQQENDNGILVDCTHAYCTECEHETMSIGTGEASVKRCLVLMREECPMGRKNFYVSEEED